MVAKKSISRIFSILFVLVFIHSVTPLQTANAASVRYAKPNGTGNCSSWINACTLQIALTGASSGFEIWVAAGTYKPTIDPTDRTATFQLKSGVALYGGFAGSETIRSQRNPAANLTILSGDIDSNDTNNPVTSTSQIMGNNSYHVVLASGTDSSTILDGFTITAGSANDSAYPSNVGGGMFNGWWPTGAIAGGNPSLTNIDFSGNWATSGGGVFNSGSATFTSSSFSGNSAYDGGGMINYGGSPKLNSVEFSYNQATLGGGLENGSNGNSQLDFVTFKSNSASVGGGMYNNGSSPILADTTFSTNTATESGGGMYNNNSSSPRLTRITFNGNSATQTGGGLSNADNSGSNPTLTNVTFSGNSANVGGGIYNGPSNNSILTEVTFIGNSANSGGGMDNGASGVTLRNVTFKDNSVTQDGGGMYNQTGSPTLTNVKFDGNSADREGGGMYNYSSSPVLMNAIFSNNSSDYDGGGMFDIYGNPILTNVTFFHNTASNDGGGMWHQTGSPTLTNVTFSGNSAIDGGGMYFSGFVSGSPVITNAIFWGNTGSGYGAQLYFYNSTSRISFSVLQQDWYPVGCNCTNIITADPLLGTLGNYGGYTQTIPLLAGSSAIDKGNDSVCPDTDQRGVSRPQGSHCDIGAFEAGNPSIYLPLIIR